MACGSDSSFDLGIIGGGQLGRMLTLAALPLGIRPLVLDPDPHCAAAAVAEVITGPLDSADHLRRLIECSRVTTFEIEHTNPRFLRTLAADGHRILPAPDLLELVADKLRQKQHFARYGLPVPPIIAEDAVGPSPYPESVIQKARFGGYDGRGVARVEAGAVFPLSGKTFVEEAIPIAVELAVLVARDIQGEVRHWEPVEMVFDARLNLVSSVVTPARVSPEIRSRAIELARGAAESLAPAGLVGVLAVELFVDTNGTLWINEVAPRPHNSGHLTIESSRCNQFEQHLRAVLGLPLGDTASISDAAMVNLVGPDHGPSGAYAVGGLADACAIPDVHLHLYGKPTIRPGRKMGHVTARGSSAEVALHRARQAAEALTFHPKTEGAMHDRDHYGQ
jgi:5-(carboxyamino)imidazole ribonucleotide synthase